MTAGFKIRRLLAGVQSHFACCVLILALMSMPATVSAADNDAACSIRLSGIQKSAIHSIAAEILKEAFTNMDCELSVKFLPGRRSLEWAQEGVTDGDIARIAGMDKQFSNLIRVPSSIISMEGIPFSISQYDINGWEDLRGLTIGIVRGILYAEIGTRGMKVFYGTDTPSLFRLLKEGRVDVVVATKVAGNVEISRSFAGSGIHATGPALHKAELFTYINKNKAAYVDPLSRAIQAMKANGRTDEIYQQTIRKLSAD